MNVTAWRIVKARHAASAFTGDGARTYGGRWNSKGTAIVYTAGSESLATLELLVHLGSHQILQAYKLCEVTFDERLIADVDRASLPANWRTAPAPRKLRQIGDSWASGQASAVLRVPSAIVPAESNYLLNPRHPDFRRMRIGRPKPFRFDSRLIKGAAERKSPEIF